MKKIFFIAIVVLLMLSCNNTNNISQTTNTDITAFYPYTTAIKKQADSLIKNNFLFIKKEKDSTGKEKTAAISQTEFQQLIADFIANDITQHGIKKFYKESVFNDATTQSTVMNYRTTTDSLPIKNVDVLLNINNTEILKRVDIKMMNTKNDSVITENISWVFGKEFYKITLTQAANGNSTMQKTNISWIKK